MEALLNDAADVFFDVVLSPALWLCVLFGLTYGALFTLWRGGGARQLLRDLVIGVLGFGLGQLIAAFLYLPTVRVGEVHLLWGSLVAVLALLAGRRLWRPRAAGKTPPAASAPGAPTGGSSSR